MLWWIQVNFIDSKMSSKRMKFELKLIYNNKCFVNFFMWMHLNWPNENSPHLPIKLQLFSSFVVLKAQKSNFHGSISFLVRSQFFYLYAAVFFLCFKKFHSNSLFKWQKKNKYNFWMQIDVKEPSNEKLIFSLFNNCI